MLQYNKGCDKMFDKMISIAKSKLSNITENTSVLPLPQVAVLLTDKNNIYVAVNDIDGSICEEMTRENDTKIVKMLTMWKNGCIDLPSTKFRKSLVEIDEHNNLADILLRGKTDYLIKKLSATIG